MHKWSHAYKVMDVITHALTSITKLPLKFEYRWVITVHLNNECVIGHPCNNIVKFLFVKGTTCIFYQYLFPGSFIMQAIVYTLPVCIHICPIHNACTCWDTYPSMCICYGLGIYVLKHVLSHWWDNHFTAQLLFPLTYQIYSFLVR